MKHKVSLALIVLLTGCASAPLANDCAGLTGNFRATNFGFTGINNPGLVRDFGALGATHTIGFNNGIYTSTFATPGASPLVRTGPFTAAPGALTLGPDPLYPGFTGSPNFVCTRTATGFSLAADRAMFDFDNDGIAEPARFRGDFAPF